MSEPSRTTSPRSLALATLSAGSAGLLLLLQSLAARTLTIEDFGKFALALKLALVAEALMDFGLHQATIRAVARDRNDAAQWLHNILSLKLLTGAAVLLAMALVVLGISPDADVRIVCLVMLASAVLRSYMLTVRGVFLGLERFGTDAVLVVGDRVLLLAAGAGALAAGWGVLGLAAVFLGVRLLVVAGALAMTARLVGRLRFSFDPVRWRDLQGQAWRIGLFLALLNVYSYADTIMLGAMSTFAETALYSAAFMLYEGLAYAPAILSTVLTPRLSALWREDRDGHTRLGRQGVSMAVLLAAVLAIPLWFAASPLLSVLFGTDAGVSYSEATGAFHILLLGLPFIFALWILQAIAISVFREHLLLKTTATGVVLNIILNMFLIPAWGRDGAALATLISEGVSLVLLVLGLRRFLWGAAPPADERDEGPVETSTEAFGNLQSNLDFLARYSSPATDLPILEVGSGRCALLSILRSRNLPVFGMDRNGALLSEAAVTHGALPVAQADAQTLPFASGAFSTVLSFDVFEHLPDPDAHLREVSRVLAPRGVYLLQTPNKYSNTIFETIRWRSFTRWRADHCSLHTFTQLTRRLEQHGFDVEFADVPVVTPFFRAKVRQHLGPLGTALLTVLNLDRWPLSWRTNFFVRATKRGKDCA